MSKKVLGNVRESRLRHFQKYVQVIQIRRDNFGSVETLQQLHHFKQNFGALIFSRNFPTDKPKVDEDPPDGLQQSRRCKLIISRTGTSCSKLFSRVKPHSIDKIISEVGLSEIYCRVMLPNSWINVVNDLRYANDTIVVANT